MPSRGLSLVGFMDEAQAINHLRSACVPPDPTDAALRAVWQAAQARLGPPTPNAGLPDIQPIPPAQAPYMLTLTQTAHAQQTLQLGGGIHLVEIDPLLAFQFTVDLDRSEHHCRGISAPPTPDEVIALCLPLAIAPEAIQVDRRETSLLLKARCLNVKMLSYGWFPPPPNPGMIGAAGILVGLTSPLVHVVRFQGRCYLHNGFHRTVGARMAGATHIACVLRDVPDEQSVGIRGDGTTFPAAALTGPNPPTLAHFAPTKACAVQLRAHSRIVHVSWAEYVAFDE